MPCEMCLHFKKQQGETLIDSEKMHTHAICSQDFDKNYIEELETITAGLS